MSAAGYGSAYSPERGSVARRARRTALAIFAIRRRRAGEGEAVEEIRRGGVHPLTDLESTDRRGGEANGTRRDKDGARGRCHGGINRESGEWLGGEVEKAGLRQAEGASDRVGLCLDLWDLHLPAAIGGVFHNPDGKQ